MKKIAIIGASYLQLPLVQKAKAMGIETHCFAWADRAVCKDYVDYFYDVSALDKEKILEICQAIQIDGILTIATDIITPTVTYVAQHMGLISNSYETTENATNKWKMRECFAQFKCPIPKYKIADHISSDFSDFTFPVIVKPVDMSGSRGVSKIEHNRDLGPAINYAIDSSLSKKAIIEEYIDGDEVSVETISYDGKHYILAITDKVTTGSPYFVELAHHQPSQLSIEIQSKIQQVTIQALDALGIVNGAGHTELKINSKGDIYIIEVGARMGGDFIGSHLVQLSTGYDYLKGVIEVALGKFSQPQKNLTKYSGVYFLCKETEQLMDYFKIDNPIIIHKEIQDYQLKHIKNSNDRSGYLIYQDDKKLEIK